MTDTMWGFQVWLFVKNEEKNDNTYSIGSHQVSNVFYSSRLTVEAYPLLTEQLFVLDANLKDLTKYMLLT